MTSPKLRRMILGKEPVSQTGIAPLFVRAKKADLLGMLDFVQPGDARALGRVEGAVWALGNYSFADMDEEDE